MPKTDTAERDKRILAYVRNQLDTNTFKVSQHFKIKWETAERSLKRLQADGKVFYHPNTKTWTIGDNIRIQRKNSDGQQSEKREIPDISTNSTFAISLSNFPIVRGNVAESVEKPGFVCHAFTKGEDVPSTFLRVHVKGVYVVRIVKVGRMPTSFADSDLGYSGGWYEKPMNGNYGYFGHLTLPDDPKPFRFQSLGTKEKGLTTLNVYVHPRYIYYKEYSLTASIEFRMQVGAVLRVLESHGWQFGDMEQRGQMHMGLNNPVLPSLIPINHTDIEGAPIHFDSSVKDGKDGFCTEAEVYEDHPNAENEVEFWITLPQEFRSVQAKVEILGRTTEEIYSILDMMATSMTDLATGVDKLTQTVQQIVEQTNLNTTVLLGSLPTTPKDEPVSYVVQVKKGDVMYG